MGMGALSDGTGYREPYNRVLESRARPPGVILPGIGNCLPGYEKRPDPGYGSDLHGYGSCLPGYKKRLDPGYVSDLHGVRERLYRAP